MRIPNRKSRTERLLKSIGGYLEVPSALRPSRLSRIKSALPSPIRTGGVRSPLTARLSQGGTRTTGIVAGGLAGLTAGSARISALRRRQEGAGDHS